MSKSKPCVLGTLKKREHVQLYISGTQKTQFLLSKAVKYLSKISNLPFDAPVSHEQGQGPKMPLLQENIQPWLQK